MSVVIRVADADWSGKGLPNINPFVATESLEFAFDVRNGMPVDVTGKHTITPMRVEPAAQIFTMPDPTIMTTVDGGIGVRVDLGCLLCSYPATPIPLGGSKKLTIMLVGRSGGVAFPPDKVMSTAPSVMVDFDWGSLTSAYGLSVERAIAGAGNQVRMMTTTPVLSDQGLANPIGADVKFLIFDGAQWSLINKTTGYVDVKSNAALSLPDPIPVAPLTASWVSGKVILGGSGYRNSTSKAYSPVIYQRAMWNRVLTGAEMDEQYLRTRAGRSGIGL